MQLWRGGRHYGHVLRCDRRTCLFGQSVMTHFFVGTRSDTLS